MGWSACSTEHRKGCGCSRCRPVLPRPGLSRCRCGHVRALHDGGTGACTFALVEAGVEHPCGCKAYRGDGP